MVGRDGWGGDYNVEQPYTFGFFRELTPGLHNFALAIKGVAVSGTANPAFTYCELGCGQGVTATLLAAAHPDAQFYATDFIPAHVTHARRLAALTGLSNITFFDDSFEELADRDLPEMDCIVLHGVYSWVSPATRRGIVAFIRKHLKVGGVFYVSYNSLPGWATAAPLRDMLVAHASGTSAPIDQRFEAAFAFAGKMEAVGAKCFPANPTLKPRLDMFATMSRTYLAQEYLAHTSQPMYFREVAQELSAAKLTFVGSAHLTDHIDAVNLTAEQIELLADVPDPMIRETLRDFMTNQEFRRDLFVRGPLHLGGMEQLEQLRDMRFTLSQAASDMPRTIIGMNGEASLEPAICDPIIHALSDGPMTLRQMGGLPDFSAMDVSSVLQAVAALVGGDALQPSHSHDDATETARRRSTDQFNHAIMELSRHSHDYRFLASPVTGGGVLVDRLDQLFLLAKKNYEPDAVTFVWNILLAANHRAIRDGQLLLSDEENIGELRGRFRSFTNERLPILRKLNVA